MGERGLGDDVGQRHRCLQRRVLIGHGQRQTETLSAHRLVQPQHRHVALARQVQP
jgi:hypothetical protein